MKKILHVVQHLKPGGIESLVLEMLINRNENEDIRIISLEGNAKHATESWPRLKEFSSRMVFLNKPAGLSISTFLRLVSIFKSLKPHCVHTHHIGPMLYGGVAARMAGVKKILHTEHDAWHLGNEDRRSVQKLALKLAKPIVVADAETVFQGYTVHLKQEPDHVIKNGINTDKFRPGDMHLARQKFGLPLSKRLVGCSGRLEAVKCQDQLIKALIDLEPDVDLALAGIGSKESELRELAKALGMEGRVHFLGLVDDMPSFYQAIDVFCLPSSQEGYPLSPLEAQACGTPAVVTAAGGSYETLCPVTGVLVKKDRLSSLVKGIDKLLERPPVISPRLYVKEHADLQLMLASYRKLMA